MSDTLESLRRKINGARDLESVVRTMKVLAASSIGQYEKAIRSLEDYYRCVEAGLSVYFSRYAAAETLEIVNANSKEQNPALQTSIDAVIFGSDQGLVGQFNDALTGFALTKINEFIGPKNLWAVGDRIYARLEDSGMKPIGLFNVPGSVAAITALVSRIIIECETARAQRKETPLYVFYNHPKRKATYEPTCIRLLPLDETWSRNLAIKPWPAKNIPEIMNAGPAALLALVREYLFVVLFRACAESLASENASRLAAMQRAEKNIEELMQDLNRSYHRLRQSSIDEELFDVISGFEALNKR